jgi:hypothetical protein
MKKLIALTRLPAERQGIKVWFSFKTAQDAEDWL